MNVFTKTALRRTSPAIRTRNPLYILNRCPFAPIMSTSRAASTAKHQSISDAIIHDHNELKDFYQKYKNAANDTDKEAWANQFRWELARHSVGEELLLYPAFEKYLGAEGKKMADEDRREHQTAKDLLAKLETMNVKDSSFAPTFEKLMNELEKHMKGEEQNDLPKFEQAIGSDESLSMATSFSRTKKFVPTRSHPGAPDKPPFETVGGLLLAPIDKLKDMFDRFPKDESGPVSQ